MVQNSYATKECLYCGRTNRADTMQCAGCGAASFGPIQYSTPPRSADEFAPPVPQAPVEQVSPAVRIIYFFLFGYIAGLCLLLLAVVFMLTIIGYPLGRALLRMLPAVWTLQREREPLSHTLGQGWRATLAKYRTAPLWGKVLAPLALAVYVGAIIWYVAG